LSFHEQFASHIHILSNQTVAARLAVPKASLAMATGLVVATSTIGFASTNCAEPIPVYGVPGTNQERTFIACKPDAVQRGLVGAIIARFETRGKLFKVEVL
jgi:nucleoside-diphosphate kinase